MSAFRKTNNNFGLELEREFRLPLRHDATPIANLMPFDVKALLVSRDKAMLHIFGAGFRSLEVTTQSVEDMASAANYWLRSRIEGIVIDFDDVADQVSIFSELRNHRPNQNATVIAVAKGPIGEQLVSKSGAQFLVTRPFIADQVQQTIEAAYRLMLRGRRQHFRLTISLDVSLCTDDGVTMECFDD